jgi:hypothetical protein
MTDPSEACAARDTAKPVRRVWLPHILIVCWLLYLSASIWQHALHSVQTPFYDPLTYMEKAANFWRHVHRGHFFNPLNLNPTSRPPGTILMSYPFGLTTDFRGFYFRSIFLPILSIVVAIYIVAGVAQAKANAWRVASMAFFFSSLPMFYGMDWQEKGFGWGMVDAFQAGIAAMATAAVLRSQRTKSRSWLLFGALLASFTLLVKPSGLMVMALTFLIWLILIVFEWLMEWRLRPPASSLRSYALRGAAIFLYSYTLLILLCVNSHYLSPNNFDFARKALAVMRKILATNSFLPLLHRSSGELMPLWMTVVSALILYHVFFSRKRDEGIAYKPAVFLAAAYITWLLGAWYWMIVQAGASQYRFFYPFMLMGCICMVTPALYVWPRIGRPAGWMLMIGCFVPAVNMAALLAAGDAPSSRWQDISGISVSVGGGRVEVSQAYAFLEEVRKTKKDQRLYFFPNNITVQSSFALVGHYEKLLRPDLASFSNVHALDWARGFAIRIGELLSCDYILVNKYSEAETLENLSSTHLDTFEKESRAFESWVFTQNERSGLKIVSDGPKLRLFHIADPDDLHRAIDRFVSTHQWRPEFKAANPPIE